MAVITGITGDASGDANGRFQRFLRQALIVARRYVEADGENAPLTPAARSRALNLLQYAFSDEVVWRETCELLLALAPKMERAGYRKEWLPYLVKGIQLAEGHNEQYIQGMFYLYSGTLHRLQNQYAQARSCLGRAVAIFGNQARLREQARTLNQLGYVAYSASAFDEAVQLAHEALALFNDADASDHAVNDCGADGTNVERATSLSLLGLVAKERLQWHDAEQYHRQALALREAAAQLRIVAWSLQNLADTLRGQGKYDAAIEYFQQAMTILEEVKDPANLATVQMNLGIVYLLQEDLPKAYALFEAAETAFEQLGNRQYLAKAKVNKGLVYLGTENWDRAEFVFRAGSQIFADLANKGEEWNALDGLGIAYLEQERYSEALALFECLFAGLADIKDTHFYRLLSDRLPEQIARAKAGLDPTSTSQRQ